MSNESMLKAWSNLLSDKFETPEERYYYVHNNLQQLKQLTLYIWLIVIIIVALLAALFNNITYTVLFIGVATCFVLSAINILLVTMLSKDENEYEKIILKKKFSKLEKEIEHERHDYVYSATVIQEDKEILKQYNLLDINFISEDLEFLKRQYRKMMKKYHPDVLNDQGEMATKINLAYSEILKYLENKK